ncbi:MAG: hypothetical protein LIR50_15230 [Bacillota bacterium]|nr:hypothetical protein [Bacillota bacterium]
MFYLFLAILCSSSIALIFKYSENRKMNRYIVTSINYLTALTISLLMIINNHSINFRKISLSSAKFIEEFSYIIYKNNGQLSESTSIIFAVLLGIIGGIFFFLSFIYYQKSVKENGAALSGTFGKLGILLPMIFSVLLWKEIPKTLQTAGILLALFSIIYVNISLKENKKINMTLILLFIFGGMAEFQNKLFQKYGLIEYKDLFLFVVFTMAFLFSSYFVLRSVSGSHKSIKGSELLIGFLVGIPNLFSSYFLIMALNFMPTSAALPIYSAGSIIFISLGEVLLYKAIISKKNKIAIILVVFAIILINGA